MSGMFCDLLSGKAEATYLYRDDHLALFMDIQPVNPGHALVIAVHHFVVAQIISAALRKSGLQCDGVNLFFADGAAAMQEIFHTHLHVIPRFSGDGFGLRFSETYNHRPSREMLEAAAAKIRASIEE